MRVLCTLQEFAGHVRTGGFERLSTANSTGVVVLQALREVEEQTLRPLRIGALIRAPEGRMRPRPIAVAHEFQDVTVLCTSQRCTRAASPKVVRTAFRSAFEPSRMIKSRGWGPVPNFLAAGGNAGRHDEAVLAVHAVDQQPALLLVPRLRIDSGTGSRLRA